MNERESMKEKERVKRLKESEFEREWVRENE